MTIDELQVLITANSSGLKKELAKVQGDVKGLQTNVSKSTNGIAGAFALLKTGIVALGIGAVIQKSVMAGVNAIESDSLFEVSMGKWADATRAWSEEMQTALGLSAIEMRKVVGTIYNMTTSMGVNGGQALKMSKGLALLSNDMASFYNISQEEAFTKLSAGLTGEIEPLKRIGIIVNDATVQQVAYNTGIAETGSVLTDQQKILARYTAIMQQTKNAQGDLARTINSPANQMRILSTSVTNLGIAFSQFLIPILGAVLPWLNTLAIMATSALNALGALLGFKAIASGGTAVKGVSDGVSGLGDNLKDATGDAKKLKGTLAGFDEMNVLTPPADSSGSGGGSGGGSASSFDVGEYNAHLDWVNNTTADMTKKIKGMFTSIGVFAGKIWDTAPVQAFVGLVSSMINFLYSGITQLGSAIWTNLVNTWTNIAPNVILTFNNILALFTLYWTDLGTAITTYSQPIIDGVVGLFNTIWTDALDPAMQLYAQMWADWTGILLKTWQDNGKAILDGVGTFITNLLAYWQQLWDNVLYPIIQPFLEMLSDLWDKHLKGMLENIAQFVAKLVGFALLIYNQFIFPITKWLLETLKPAFAFLGTFVSGVLGTILGTIGTVVGSIFGILGGLIDFMTGIFTGNWKKAWQGLVDIAKSIFDGIGAIVKYPLNLLIDLINGFISGINAIKIPDWVPGVGGKNMNIPKIPKLAQGGIIDKATLAVVGESGKEAVMPLENNTGWINDLASKLNGANSGQATNITVKLGEETIFSKLIEGINGKSYERNAEVLVI